jgi:hypothetical protein
MEDAHDNIQVIWKGLMYFIHPTLPKCGSEDVSGYGLHSRDVKR